MPRIVTLALGSALLIPTLGLHAVGLYSAGLFIASALAKPRRRGPAPATLPRIAVLVIAHDEERVIAEPVRSLLAQTYPRDRFAVLVVADRCTDGTAAVAREVGARVLERAEGEGGKAAAVAHGVRAVTDEGGFDAIAVFDADNVAAPDFLGRVGERLASGERIVQGLVDCKNPGASWVASASALGFWAIAAVAQTPRERLGLSTPLMGTGFVMRLDEARRLLLAGESLTDDLELAARLAMDGIRVAHEPLARTLDEKPVTLRTAVSQRQRWMQGRAAVAAEWLPRLLRRALGPGGGSAAARARTLDVAFQLVAPSLLFTGVALGATTAGVLAARTLGATEVARLASPVPLRWSLAAAAVYYLLPAAGIARFRPPLRVWGAYLAQPSYLALSAPLALSGWLGRRGRSWARTPKGERP